jgi:quercetin dioxygenase-like cupin family protein
MNLNMKTEKLRALSRLLLAEWPFKGGSMTRGVFTVAQKPPLRDGMTISRDAGLQSVNSVIWFSLGKDTSISQESYDTFTLYLVATGSGSFLLGGEGRKTDLEQGSLLIVPGKTLCGVESRQGIIYTEIITSEEIFMNHIFKAGEAFKLKNLVSYEEGSIANLDIARNDTMRFVLMAFDEGTSLQPHRAPGNALITALEGKAVIGYEGQNHTLTEGESFLFEKNGLHSVTAEGRFKMALLLVLK